MPKRPASPIAVMSARGISSFSSISFSCGESVSSTNLRTEVCRSFSSSGNSRSTCCSSQGLRPCHPLRVLEHHSQPNGYALRAERRGAADDDLDGAHLGAVEAIGAIDGVLERPGRVPHLADADLDVELVVEAQRRAIFDACLADREVDAAIEELRGVVEAKVTQICGPSHLGVEEIVGVVDALLHV